MHDIYTYDNHWKNNATIFNFIDYVGSSELRDINSKLVDYTARMFRIETNWVIRFESDEDLVAFLN